MNNEIIKKIEIEIGGVSVKITPKEAHSLLDALNELLNPETKVKIVEVEKYIPYKPYKPYKPYEPLWYWNDVTTVKTVRWDDTKINKDVPYKLTYTKI